VVESGPRGLPCDAKASADRAPGDTSTSQLAHPRVDSGVLGCGELHDDGQEFEKLGVVEHGWVDHGTAGSKGAHAAVADGGRDAHRKVGRRGPAERAARTGCCGP
jgi:hypothetical protein